MMERTDYANGTTHALQIRRLRVSIDSAIILLFVKHQT